MFRAISGSNVTAHVRSSSDVESEGGRWARDGTSVDDYDDEDDADQGWDSWLDPESPADAADGYMSTNGGDRSDERRSSQPGGVRSDHAAIKQQSHGPGFMVWTMDAVYSCSLQMNAKQV